MPFYIDPTQLTPEHTTILLALFSAPSQQHVFMWPQDEVIDIQTHPPFVLTHSILQRARQLDQQNQPKRGSRYELFNMRKPLAKGGQGVIYISQGTLALTDDTLIYHNKKQRVIKQCSNNNLSHVEATLYQRKTVLHVKKATEVVLNDSPIVYLVMKRAIGKTMHELLESGLIPQLAAMKRHQLSLALLTALDEQITSQALVHRDIKPHNIIVDLETLCVTIIDYGCAIPLTPQPLRQVSSQDNMLLTGTVGYIAPEMWEQKHHLNTDVFAMAIIIGYVWGIKPKRYKKTGLTKAMQETESMTFHDRLPLLRDVHCDDKCKIECLLTKMTTADPEQRLTIQQAITEFKALSFQPIVGCHSPMNNDSVLASSPHSNNVHIPAVSSGEEKSETHSSPSSDQYSQIEGFANF